MKIWALIIYKSILSNNNFFEVLRKVRNYFTNLINYSIYAITK